MGALSGKTKKSKGRKRRGLALVPVCAIAIAIAAINIHVITTAEAFIVSSDEARDFATGSGVDCILVLGASVSEAGPSPILANRIDKGLELFGMGTASIMLLSGDNGTDDYNEVQAMKNYALKNGANVGLTAENVYLDYAGFSTYDSAVRCKDVFQARRVVIVTQRYHLYRAVYNARLVGLEVVGVAAKDTAYGQKSRDLREIPARVKDFFLTHIGYTPKIMGDPVPLVYPSTQS